MERNFCLLILFSCSLFGSENFWFSYKVATENKILVYEERNISPFMQDSEVSEYKSLCRIDAIKEEHQSTEKFLNQHFAKLLTCFYPMSTQVINKTLVELKGMDESSVLTITPTRFTVDFKDEFANINILR